MPALKVMGFVIALGAAGAANAQAAAILDGATIQTTYLYPDTSTLYAAPVNSVVGAGVELLSYAGFVDIDFSDTNIRITTVRNAGVNNVSFDGLRFFDVNGLIPSFSSLSLNAATNYQGFDASRLTFDANTIFVNVANLPGLQGQVISIDLSPSTTVPEPTSVLLLGSALLGAGVRRWRQSRA